MKIMRRKGSRNVTTERSNLGQKNYNPSDNAQQDILSISGNIFKIYDIAGAVRAGKERISAANAVNGK